MIEINGKYTNAKIFTNIIEPDAIKQIQFLCNHPLFENKKIRIMPDVHPSKATVVGLCAEINTQHIIPQLLGTDIGCNITAYKITGKTLNDFDKLDKIIRNLKVTWNESLNSTYIKEYGTIGSGNHFISIEKGQTGTYLIIHSGSRTIGKDIAIKYSKLALEQNLYKGGEEKQLSWLNEESSKNYIFDMMNCMEYALCNQEDIVKEICKQMKWKYECYERCFHNYIDLEHKILHKGSISLINNQGIIPINMADGTLIVGHCADVDVMEDWLYCAPHGAGRLLKRSECIEKLNMQEFKNKMKDIHCKISSSLIDESPMAYKNIEDIKNNIPYSIIDHLIPVYNYKN